MNKQAQRTLNIIRIYFSRPKDATPLYFVILNDTYYKLNYDEFSCKDPLNLDLLDRMKLQTLVVERRTFKVIKNYGRISLI